MIYNNDLAKMVETLGYHVILTEVSESGRILGWRRPNYIYTSPSNVSR